MNSDEFDENGEWIDEDDAPELTGEELYRPTTKFYVGGVEVSREVGIAEFGKEFNRIYRNEPKKHLRIHKQKSNVVVARA